MRKDHRSKVAAAVALALLLFATNAWAQCRSQRVQFPRGRTTAVLKGRVTATRNVCYELRARSGQRMTVRLVSPHKGAKFGVMPPGFDREPVAEGVTNWEAELDEGGDYAISINVPRGTATYTLEVTIR